MSGKKSKVNKQAKKVIKKMAKTIVKAKRRQPRINKPRKQRQGMGPAILKFADDVLLGGAGQRFIGRVRGRGDYVLSGPVVKNNSLTNGTSPPAFGGNAHATVVRHREYLTDVYTGNSLVSGSTAFNYNIYNINPGMPDSFPWLAQVAQNYEEYELRGMLFEFKSTSANALNSTNTALGTVILSTEYNVLNSPFTSKLTQENYEFAQSIKPSESCLHAVECARDLNVLSKLYVRTVDDIQGDLRMYDIGKFQISTVGMQAANVNIGELWVTYDVALYKPRIPAQINSTVAADQLTMNSPSNGSPMGITVSPVSGSNLGVSLDSINQQLVFPLSVTTGNYMVQWKWAGTATACTPPVPVAISGCSRQDYYLLPTTGTTTNRQVVQMFISIFAGGARVGFTGTTVLPTSLTSAVVYVLPVPQWVSVSKALSTKDDDLFKKFQAFVRAQQEPKPLDCEENCNSSFSHLDDEH